MKDLTNLKTYIIDTKNPREIDDAISLENGKDGVNFIWVHISYPAKLFKFNSELDIRAKENCCSLYLVDEYIPMIDNETIDKLNLKQDKVSETLSTRIELDQNGDLKDYEIIEAIIKPDYEISYDEANELLEIEPKEEYELVKLNKLLIQSYNFRKNNGAIMFEMPYSKLTLDKNNEVKLEKAEITMAHRLVSEAMILMGYAYSKFLIENNIPAPFRSQRINCDSQEILEKNYNSPVKYSILKQFIGKSYISTKANFHETLGLKSYVQATSPLRRYLDLIVQRQVHLKINNLNNINEEIISEIIDNNKLKQIDANNIFKQDKLKYLKIFFNKKLDNNKIIFIRWINNKKNIALVYFPDYYIETLIILYTSIETYPNKIYKVNYNKNESSNLLEFIY